MFMILEATEKLKCTFLFQGNVNHWAIQRVKAEDYVAAEKIKEMKAKGKWCTVEVPPGMTSGPFIWSWEKARAVKLNSKPFDQVSCSFDFYF